MIDPHDPDWYLAPDHHDVLAWLRSEAPLFEYKPGYHAISTYRDVRAISRDQETFISRRGVLVNDPVRTLDPFPVPPTLLWMDPPEHRKYRELVSRAFTPRTVRLLEPRIRDLARRAVDQLPNGRPVDAVAALAVSLPVAVIAELLGLPEEQHGEFRRRSDVSIGAGENDPVGIQAALQLFEFLQGHVEDARRRGGDHLIARLVAAELDGRRLSDAEVQVFCLTLLVGGNETTRHLISGAILCLAEHPGQLVAIRRQPELLPGAIEEILRWTTPVKAFARTAARSVTVGGGRIREGDYAVMLCASGNRDGTVFGPTACRFDVTRKPDPAHIAFGFGEHLCLGASLARLEARVLLEELLARADSIELAGTPDPVRSTIMNGWQELPVRFFLAS